MKWLAIMLLAAGTAHAQATPATGCDVPRLTCTDEAHRVECRVPGVADIERMIIYVRVDGGPFDGRLMERRSACTFALAASELGDEYYVSARGVDGAINFQSAPRRFGATEPLVVEHAPERVETRSHGGRVMLELAAGGAAGLASGYLTFAIGAHYSPANHDEGASAGLVLGSYAIAIAGLSVAVWAVGSIGDENGSLAWTVVGGTLGGLAGVAIVASQPTIVGVASLIALPITGALLGFNLTREVDAPPIGSAFTLDGGRVRLGVPLAVATRDGAMLSVLSGRF